MYSIGVSMKTYDLIIKNAMCAVPVSLNDPLKGVQFKKVDLGIIHGKIEEVGSLSQESSPHVIEGSGLHVLPGLIDTQVHFREPGLEHKEDLSTGTQGAILGGITAVFEMPNTSPGTTTQEALEHKIHLAQDRAFCDYAFYVGACPENIDQLTHLETLPGVCGVKVFMGSSTGSLLVSQPEMLDLVVKNGRRRMAAHCEDESRLIERKALVIDQPGDVKLHPVWRDELTALNATKLMVQLAEKHGRPVHVLHVTTQQEMQFLKDHKLAVTVECTPQHLTLSSPQCYEELGTLAQMNPPIRSEEHQKALWEGVANNTVDIIGSDHAPHTLKEKLDNQYPNTPSGMTGVQTTVPVMLNHVHEGRLTLERLVELMCLNPCKLFGIKNRGAIKEGYEASLTLVDLKKQVTITDQWIASRSGWTPFDGKKVVGWPTHTLLRGKVVMEQDEIKTVPQGRPLEFQLFD